jgi:hypothetical protein
MAKDYLNSSKAFGREHSSIPDAGLKSVVDGKIPGKGIFTDNLRFNSTSDMNYLKKPL